MAVGFDKLSDQDLSRLQMALTPKWTKYIPIQPTPKQTAALLMDNVKELLYGGAAGGGKALALDTPIPTVERGMQTMETIQVGDLVYDDFGRPCEVTAKGPVYTDHACYKVDFLNESSVVADADHEWVISTRPDRYEELHITTEKMWEVYEKLHRVTFIQSVKDGVVTKHQIKAVVKIDPVPVQCISVDSMSHMYSVTKDMIPTHNSVFLLAAALQYVDRKGYAAILFRKTFSDLMLPGALIPMSKEWLGPYLDSGEVHWADKDKRYTFKESGATLTFGYLDNKDDHLRYQGAEFSFIGMDECTHISPESYRYLFSRLRKTKDLDFPLRFRATANPGGTYGDYYYDRFFVDNLDEEGNKKRFFLPSGLKDNPHLDREAYLEALAELDPITREQLENGNWEIRPTGDLFDTSWIISINVLEVPSGVRWVRFWDLAAVDPKHRKNKNNTRNPDYTVGFKLGFYQGNYYIADILQFQKAPGDTEKIVYQTAVADGHSCAIRMEEEPGSAGMANTERYARYILQGFDFAGVKPLGSKAERARPAAAACQTGCVFLVSTCRNVTDFFAQLSAFPNGIKDDLVDGFSGAFSYFKPSNTNYSPPPRAIEYRARVDRGEPAVAVRTGSTGSYWHKNMSGRYR